MTVGFDSIGKFLILFGGILLLVGILFLFIGKIPFLGKLPGDLYLQKGRWSFYFPLATCILISIMLTLLFSLFRRR